LLQNWYTSLPGHDYFCDVHEEFIEDDFNLTGMKAFVHPIEKLTFRSPTNGSLLEGSIRDGFRC